MDIVDDLRDLNSMHTPKEISDIGEKAADEIERLRQLVIEMGSVEYVIDGHGIAHHNFTIVYRELE